MFSFIMKAIKLMKFISKIKKNHRLQMLSSIQLLVHQGAPRKKGPTTIKSQATNRSKHSNPTLKQTHTFPFTIPLLLVVSLANS